MTDDPVAARLAEIRERQESGWRDVFGDAPALLAALESVLARHSPDLTEHAPQPCKSDPFTWPCPTYRAIAAALPGRETTDGN